MTHYFQLWLMNRSLVILWDVNNTMNVMQASRKVLKEDDHDLLNRQFCDLCHDRDSSRPTELMLSKPLTVRVASIPKSLLNLWDCYFMIQISFLIKAESNSPVWTSNPLFAGVGSRKPCFLNHYIPAYTPLSAAPETGVEFTTKNGSDKLAFLSCSAPS